MSLYILDSDHLSLHQRGHEPLKSWLLSIPPEMSQETLFAFLEHQMDEVNYAVMRFHKELPEIINTPKMRQAMAVLERFSEKEADYHLYQARQNAIREEKTRQKLLEDALRREEDAVREKEEAVRDKEQEKAKNERLMEILKKAGIDPDV